jgi:hypothetical protein
MNNELDALKGILEELSRTAEKASLTGAFDDGRAAAARRFNGVLERLSSLDVIPQGLFSPLSENATMGEVAVESRSLMGALQSGDNKHKNKGQDDGLRLAIKLAPFADEKDLAQLIRNHLRSNARIDVDALTALAPFIGSDTLGELIRAVSDFSEKPQAEAKPAPRAPEPPQTPVTSVAPAAPVPTAASTVTDEVVVSTRREEILRLLGNPHVGREQRLELAMELTALESDGA